MGEEAVRDRPLRADSEDVTRALNSRPVRRCASSLLALALLAGMCSVFSAHQHAFAHAVKDVSYGTLLLAAGIHVLSLLARSEAWSASVRAAGGKLGRRESYQVASLGFAANVMSPSLGTAMRIWAARTAARDRAPSARTLLAAELPVFAMHTLVTAAMSFALVGRLGAPLWLPPTCFAVAAALLFALCRASRSARGPWRGLAALRDGATSTRIGASVVAISTCETLRNLLLLRAVGVHAGPLDAMALLVGAGVIGVLPIGPGGSASAAMLLFGAAGVGPAAAAGVLLTATGFTADLGYAAWGAGDMLWRRCPVRARRLALAADLGAAMCCAGIALSAVALT
jgi:uncharacterized membrane protein YbhN (UPF0104 family)